MTTHPTTPPSADRPPDDPRLALLRALNTPPYDLAAGKTGSSLGEAAQLIDAYRAANLRDFLWRLAQSSGDQVAAKLVEDNPEWAELLDATEATPPHTMLGAAELEEKLELKATDATEVTDG